MHLKRKPTPFIGVKGMGKTNLTQTKLCYRILKGTVTFLFKKETAFKNYLIILLDYFQVRQSLLFKLWNIFLNQTNLTAFGLDPKKGTTIK